ncbi:hypothetical protein [Chryseobacterium sp. GP-SGM7]|uniref:hypothetical protein n=1 Tax=Chryseobacterium sp. GP-SGM7 TaxID=3411323 RepID=UPI003B9438C9
MNLKHQLISLLLIFIINILAIFPSSVFLLFSENGDQIWVITFGIVNAMFLKFRLKINIYTSFILGYLNVGSCIYITYLMMYFNYVSEIGKLFAYIFFTVLISWIYIKTKWEKFNLKIFNLSLFLPVLIFTWSSYQIKKYYQPKTENENLTQVEFKIKKTSSDSKQRDTLEVRVRRNSFFGLRETKRVIKKTVDDDGFCKIILSKNHNYQINIDYSDGKYDFEEITSRDLKVSNKFSIPR